LKAGFETDRWTLKRIRDVIRRQFGVSYHPKVKSYLGEHPEITVEVLPSYAPDLNAEEGCHGAVKKRLLDATPENPQQLRSQANRGFARLRHRRDLILGFFHHAGYRVKRLT
jgi:hypothetical protein